MIYNNTRFQVAEMWHQWSEPEGGSEALTLVVKATYDIQQDGRCTPADEQIAMRYTEELTGERDDAPSARLPADVIPEKQGSDVIIAGHAYFAPGETQVTTNVQVGEVSAPLLVHGPRHYESVLGSVRIGNAVTTDRVALIYEKAYGGMSEDLQRVEERNPAGVGVTSNPKSLDGTLAPQIEHPSKPFQSAKDAHTPMGYAPVMAYWEPRKSSFGTLDEVYFKQRMPLTPKDFSLRYNNQAHPSLMLSRRLSARDSVALLGLTPERLLRFQLPDLALAIRGYRDQGKPELRRPEIDTLVISPDERRIEVVARERFRLLRTNPLRDLQIDPEAA
ncbi:MAG: DUF2169 domain-containing protein [Polyangiaceae bacterium]|nr:DUF2169 domain-containing protein [Myxococcales bacterium]MCB9586031.1 DUF2169 domain-containing protein [Polyangiaceae bacterium]MCB9608953.1 DUF2169 domain-containing protein [Polyangiaceae bacterium]